VRERRVGVLEESDGNYEVIVNLHILLQVVKNISNLPSQWFTHK
jgi:hypothetical protein